LCQIINQLRIFTADELMDTLSAPFCKTSTSLTEEFRHPTVNDEYYIVAATFEQIN
jgi:hypothetical protein